MTSKVTLKAKDFDSEGTSFGLRVNTLTSANLDTTITAITGVVAAVNGIVIGDFDGLDIFVSSVPPSNVPTDPYAQREAKWHVNYTDDVNPLGNGSFEIGMPDLSLLVAGSKNLNLGAGAGLAFKNAIEGTCLSSLGNSITVTEAYHVGRNL